MIRIFEVGPRDGLQNEKFLIPTVLKAQFIRNLAEAGIVEIEATSFVSPKWIPQLADADELLADLKPDNLKISALVPNLRGLDRAIAAGITRIAVFTAASDTFTQRNINMTIEESLVGFETLVKDFRVRQGENAWVRGYISTAFECPFEGRIAPTKVADVANKLLATGVDEVVVSDTIGAASPKEIREVGAALSGLDKTKVAWHFHDTNGTAIANVAAALQDGYNTFDSAAGGLGGCPFAPGASGNLATEDLVYFLEREGIATGVDLDKLARASESVLAHLGRAAQSKAQVSCLVRPVPGARYGG